MVSATTFKNKIRRSLTQKYKIEFLGKNFTQIAELLTEKKANNIYKWVKEVVEMNIQPITIHSKKQYKEWRVYELLNFRYQFSIKNTEYRIFLIKVKNSFYIEFHLGDHKYYDKVRKELDLKKTSY